MTDRKKPRKTPTQEAKEKAELEAKIQEVRARSVVFEFKDPESSVFNYVRGRHVSPWQLAAIIKTLEPIVELEIREWHIRTRRAKQEAEPKILIPSLEGKFKPQ